VLRDASVIRTLLHALEPSEFVFRRAAVVALGLLGESVSTDEGIALRGDPADIEALILSGSLVDVTTGIRAANDAYQLATSAAAREAADAALARLEGGDFLGVIA
jgi:hypothetical protein